MCRVLFHIPLEPWGIPVFGPVVDGSLTRGPGLLLGLWLLLSLGLMAWLVRRQGLCADTWGYLPLLLLIGVLIWWLLPAVCDAEGFPIRGYGTMVLAGVVAGIALMLWRARRAGVKSDLVFSLAFWVFVAGIIGSRAFYVIEYWSRSYWPVYQQEGPAALLAAVVNVTQGGLVAYGGLIGGLVGLLLFVRRYRMAFLPLADLLAPSIMLGLALGRVGCLLNGCCFGGPCELPWAVTFPAGDRPYNPVYQAQVQRGEMAGLRLSGNPHSPPVLRSVDPRSAAGQAGLQAGDRLLEIDGVEVHSAADAHRLLFRLFDEGAPVAIRAEGRDPVTLPAMPHRPRSLPVHPTQAYSSINALLLCVLLLAYAPFRRRDGELFALMLTLYPIARFLLEMVRTDESAIFGTGLTISQNVSLLLLILAAGMWLTILRRPPGRTPIVPAG